MPTEAKLLLTVAQCINTPSGATSPDKTLFPGQTTVCPTVAEGYQIFIFVRKDSSSTLFHNVKIILFVPTTTISKKAIFFLLWTLVHRCYAFFYLHIYFLFSETSQNQSVNVHMCLINLRSTDKSAEKLNYFSLWRQIHFLFIQSTRFTILKFSSFVIDCDSSLYAIERLFFIRVEIYLQH